MALDIAVAHAPGVYGDDLVVKVQPPRLVLADQLGIEATLAVPGNLYRQIAPVVLERLGGLAALASCRGSFLKEHASRSRDGRLARPCS